jgi:hypothetical protein
MIDQELEQCSPEALREMVAQLEEQLEEVRREIPSALVKWAKARPSTIHPPIDAKEHVEAARQLIGQPVISSVGGRFTSRTLSTPRG